MRLHSPLGIQRTKMNDLKPDSDGMLRVPFHAHCTVTVQYNSEICNDELFDLAHESIQTKTPDWEINDETFSEWQGEPITNDLDQVINTLRLNGDFNIGETETGNWQWSYRSYQSPEHHSKIDCFVDFVTSKLREIDCFLNIDEET